LSRWQTGFTNAGIAKRLALSPRTVEAHVSSIISRLGAQSRTGAIRVALEMGLIKQRCSQATMSSVCK